MSTSEIFEKAREVQGAIAETPVRERVRFITRLKKVILDQREEIITQIQKETAKCRSDALMSEIFGTLDFLDYLENNAVKVLKDRKVHTPIALMGKKSYVYFEPLGTVLIIAPWNYPFFQAIVPSVLSLVTGNATVFKPSEHTPLKGLVEKVLTDSGVPENWVQVVYGDGSVGEELIRERPDRIFFTGSTKTGKKIMAQAAEQLIPVELELGGKDPMIVFEDVNLKRAAAGAAWGAFTNCGQSCTSVERLYVHRSILEPFKKELECQLDQITQGVDLDGTTDVGEMTVDFQLAVIDEHLKDASHFGAKPLRLYKWDSSSRKVPPIALESASHQMKIAHQETFGPVLPIFPFDTEEEAISLANDSAYGLSASVWSKDVARAKRVARAIKTGNVSINNVMLTEGNGALPFGGIKNSGFGRYKGEFGFYSFSNIKSVLIDADSKKIEANWYPYTKEKYQIFTKMMLGLFSKGAGAFVKFLISGLKLESYSNKIGHEGRPKN